MTYQRGAISLHLVLTIFLGIGMVLFGVLATLAYRDNSYIHTNLDQIVDREKTKSAAAQKQTDTEANRKANELPYRTYAADAVDGGFKLQIPKGWSVYAGRNNQNDVQLDLAADPDTVVYNLGASALNTHAFHLKLLRKSQQEVAKSFDDKVKQKKLVGKGVTVSGISGTWLEGVIDEQRHNGVVIILPVRDKTMTISTENKTYLEEFNKIISTASITP